MDLEIINRLFLELSQFATATTAKELKLRAELDAVDATLWPDGKPDTYEPDRSARIRALTKLKG